MNNKECIEIFKQYSKYFYSDADMIDVLENMEASDLVREENIMNVTPILNKIFNFSLIYLYSDIFYIEGLAGDNRTTFYIEVDRLSHASSVYLSNLADDKSKHPTVLRYVALGEGVANYDLLISILNSVRDSLEGSEHGIINQLFDSVNITDSTNAGFQLGDLVRNIRNIEEESKLVDCLALNALFTATRKLLLSGDENDVIETKFNNVTGAVGAVRNVRNDQTLYLTELIYQLNNMEEYIDDELESNIKYVEDYYTQYKSNQNKYLRNAMFEGMILKKCKRL